MMRICKRLGIAGIVILMVISTSIAFTVDIGSNEKIGRYLMNERGMTLYYFANDPVKTSTCFEGCAATWPPFHAEWINIPEGIASSDFDEIGRVDGVYQTTYKGRPLYLYSRDHNPGETNGEGIDGMWFAVRL
jgi:predicted lipoprotein with Yx(FWY)xxD motif